MEERVAHHQPRLLVHISSKADMVAMMLRSYRVMMTGSLAEFTMTFIPITDDRAVMGSVIDAMTASRSAAIVILVLVRVW